jgi:deoxyadenosine/deoxycytidine kinase
MHRWSFNLQIYFLNSRFSQILEIRKSNKTVIQDRTIYEDAYIFAPNLHSMGLMSTRDFETYFTLFTLMSSLVQPPDLLIYLQASVPKLVEQIQKRGRPYEANIRLDYLKRLNERYEAWISSYNLSRLLIIDVDNNDFSNNPKDLAKIIDQINAELNGLFK